MEFSEPGFEPSAAFSLALGAAPSPRPVTLTRHVLVPCPLPPLSHSTRLWGFPEARGGQARGRGQEAHPARREGPGRSAPAPPALPLSMVKAAG